MKEIEELFKSNIFTNEEHKARLQAELFDEKVISYKKRGGGAYMSNENELKKPGQDTNELSDDMLDEAAGGKVTGDYRQVYGAKSQMKAKGNATMNKKGDSTLNR